MTDYHANRDFTGEDFTEGGLIGEFEQCTFTDCVMSRAKLDEAKFIECQFDRCDLSMASIHQSSWQEIRFNNCKLLGLRFDTCNSFMLDLEFVGCQLDFCGFESMKFKHLQFQDCTLVEADFTLTDLRKVKFQKCDLTRAVFQRTLLENADFRTAIGFSIDPEQNFLTGAKFSMPEVLRLLDKYHLDIDDV